MNYLEYVAYTMTDLNETVLLLDSYQRGNHTALENNVFGISNLLNTTVQNVNDQENRINNVNLTSISIMNETY